MRHTEYHVGQMRLHAGGAGFLVLTIAAMAYQLRRIPAGEAGPHWSDLRWKPFMLLLLLVPVETLVSALRTRLVANALGTTLRFWTCVKAECANVAGNLVTPAHLGGGPAQVYIMRAAGVPVGTGVAIGLIGFAGTIVGLLGMGVYSVAFAGDARVRSLFAVSVGCIVLVALAMALAATSLGDVPRRRFPALGRALDDYGAAVRRFLRAGPFTLVAIPLLSAAFLVSRCLIAYLCIRCLGLDSSVRSIVERQMGLIFVLFFAPTPGAAGIAELVSLTAMGGIVPAAFAPYYTLAWRFSTAYVAAIAGFVWLGSAILRDSRQDDIPEVLRVHFIADGDRTS